MTQKRLKTLLHYNPQTGIFTRKIAPSNNTKIGDEVGYVKNNGYIGINLDYKKYYAHRLAWLYLYGEYPPNDIDHINRDRADNRAINLRPATRSENSFNTKFSKANTSGHRGVTWNKRRNKWQAQLTFKGLRVLCECYTDLVDAVTARKDAEKNYGIILIPKEP